jgi:cysteine synthase A
LGAGFVPKILNIKIYDEIIAVSSKDAFNKGKKWQNLKDCLWSFLRCSSFRSYRNCKRIENSGKRIIIILPDTGERYSSTPLF